MITNLILLTSSKCNYCICENSSNNCTVKILDHNEFLTTIKDTLLKLNIDSLQITSLTFNWQNDSAFLLFIIQFLSEVFDILPNIQTIKINIDKIENVSSIIEVAQVINLQHKLPVEIILKWYNDFIKINFIDNIKQAIKEFKNIKLGNIIIKFQVQRIISQRLLRRLIEYDSIDEYKVQLHYILSQFNTLGINNEEILFQSFHNATQEDGKQLSVLLKEDQLPYSNLFLQIMKRNKIKSCDDFIKLFINNTNNIASKIIQDLYDSFICDINISSLVLLQDGRLANCQNLFFNDDINIYNNNNINMIFNITNQLHNNWYFMLEQMMYQIYYLSKFKQINPKYAENNFLIFKYAFLGLTIQQCYYDNLISTGDIFLQGQGFFKFFYNGYIELLEEQYDRMLNNNE